MLEHAKPAPALSWLDASLARFEALLKAKTAVEVAEIGAGATLDAAQIGAAKEGTDG